MQDDGTMQDLTSAIKGHLYTLRIRLLEQIQTNFNIPELVITNHTLKNLEEILIPCTSKDDFDTTIIPGFTYRKMLTDRLKAIPIAMPMIKYVVTSRYTSEEIANLAINNNLTEHEEFLRSDLDRLNLSQHDQDMLYVFRLVLEW